MRNRKRCRTKLTSETRLAQSLFQFSRANANELAQSSPSSVKRSLSVKEQNTLVANYVNNNTSHCDQTSRRKQNRPHQ